MYCYSKGILMVADIQGVVHEKDYKLTDPAIHTKDLKKLIPDRTNLGTKGMISLSLIFVMNFAQN